MVDFNVDESLKKIDDISSLINRLASSDETTSSGATKDADDYIKTLEGNVKHDRTVINKNNTSIQKETSATNEADGFMKAMEADALERAERRQANNVEAERLRIEANDAFRRGDFTLALELYTKALDKRRDCASLYTNRALTNFNLGNYDAIFEDCKWALRADDSCAKAHIIEGRAHLALGSRDKAVTSFRSAVELQPSHRKIVRRYLAEYNADSENEFD